MFEGPQELHDAIHAWINSLSLPSFLANTDSEKLYYYISIGLRIASHIVRSPETTDKQVEDLESQLMSTTF